MREITIRLNDREFVAQQLTIRAEAKWRQVATEALAPFWDATGLMQLDITQPGDLRAVIDRVGAMLDPMAAIDALCAYSPVLAAEREWIEENCYADQVFAALVALFFGQLRQLERLPAAFNGALPNAQPTTSPS